MNYYERHIGDYLKDTAHLSLLEHGIYSRLLDVYYTREVGLEEGMVARLIGARSKEELAALNTVLMEFFVLEAGVYTQSRCDREIERYHDKQAKAARSANARWQKQHEHTERNANAMRTHSEGNAPSNQTPDTIQHPTDASVGGTAQDAAPTPPPPFDGRNAEVLNGKAIVPIAAAFELPEQWGVDAEALGWKPAEVMREAEKFRQYWTAGRGKGTRRAVKSWRQTWSNWLEKAAKDAR